LQFTIDELLPRLGLPQEIDDENPDLEAWKGLCFDAILRVTEQPKQRQDPENPGKYIPLLDHFGKPIMDRRVNVNTREILGRVDSPTDKPY